MLIIHTHLSTPDFRHFNQLLLDIYSALLIRHQLFAIYAHNQSLLLSIIIYYIFYFLLLSINSLTLGTTC